MFSKEDKRILESTCKTITVLSRIHTLGCKDNIDGKWLDAIADGCEVLEAKRDELEDYYVEELADDLSWHVHDAIEKIEDSFLTHFDGTKIPEGYGNRKRLDDAENNLSEVLAKLLLEEMLYG